MVCVVNIFSVLHSILHNLCIIVVVKVLVITAQKEDNVVAKDGVYHARMVSIMVDNTELSYGLQITMPTLMLAVENVNNKYSSYGIEFEVVFRNSSVECVANRAGVFAAEEYYRRHVSAFIGPGCGFALDQVARMAAYWNVPAFTAGGIDDMFAEKSIFETLTRLSFSVDRVSNFILKVLQEFEWHYISLFVNEEQEQDSLMGRSIEKACKRSTSYDLYISNYNIAPRRQKSIKTLLKAASERSRGR